MEAHGVVPDVIDLVPLNSIQVTNLNQIFILLQNTFIDYLTGM